MRTQQDCMTDVIIRYNRDSKVSEQVQELNLERAMREDPELVKLGKEEFYNLFLKGLYNILTECVQSDFNTFAQMTKHKECPLSDYNNNFYWNSDQYNELNRRRSEKCKNCNEKACYWHLCYNHNPEDILHFKKLYDALVSGRPGMHMFCLEWMKKKNRCIAVEIGQILHGEESLKKFMPVESDEEIDIPVTETFFIRDVLQYIERIEKEAKKSWQHLNTTLSGEQLEQLYHLLIKHEYISPDTSKDTFLYVFGLQDRNLDFQPVKWCKMDKRRRDESKKSLFELLIRLQVSYDKMKDTRLLNSLFVRSDGSSLKFTAADYPKPNLQCISKDYHEELTQIMESINGLESRSSQTEQTFPG